LHLRGYTLVELMIVVSIVGVLAVLATYGVRRYLASAKTAEAKEKLGAISRGAQAAFERETPDAQALSEGTETTVDNHTLCGSANPVPAAIADVAGKKYQPDSAEGSDYETGNSVTGWKCLKFMISQAQYYQYHYTRGASVVAPNNPAKSGAAGYEAAAVGDLDGDGTVSLFARTGDVVGGQLKASTQIYAERELE